ncbi:MAG: VOC family protein [Candidatus Nanohaloarchaea archaeon]|nr:VOC family protein [Candidatus Nanohaloarchaea archaeon]
MELDIVSITVDDMDRALAFYSEVFREEPARRDDRFSWFTLENVRFGLYNPAANGEAVDFGENCVAAFRTDDIEAEHERLRELAPAVEEIQALDGYRLFHFRDTEGNLMEVYAGEK